MKQFLTVLWFEFSSYLKNKVFVGITLALIIVVALVLSFPRVGSLINFNSNSNEEQKIVLISDENAVDPEITLSVFSQALLNNKVELTDKNSDELQKLVDNGDCESAIIINSPTDYAYIVKDVKLYDSTTQIITQIMQNKFRIESMTTLGLSPEQATTVLNQEITNTVIKTGKDQTQTFFYTYILIFALYMVILLYGQLVATSVATEKSSRAMEMLITSARPTNLMFGKVLGSGLAGLAQMSAVLLSSFIFFNLNKSYWENNMVVTSIFDMPLSILLYTILFFILGYFIYAFLYGAVGSLASKVEDLNTSIMPIMFIFIVAFFIVIFSMTSGEVDSVLMIIASYVPLTSPMAMFVRIAMGNVAGYEIIICVGILLLSIVGVGIFAAKIYRVGVLMYGKPPKLSEIVKSFSHSK